MCVCRGGWTTHTVGLGATSSPPADGLSPAVQLQSCLTRNQLRRTLPAQTFRLQQGILTTSSEQVCRPNRCTGPPSPAPTHPGELSRGAQIPLFHLSGGMRVGPGRKDISEEKPSWLHPHMQHWDISHAAPRSVFPAPCAQQIPPHTTHGVPSYQAGMLWGAVTCLCPPACPMGQLPAHPSPGKRRQRSRGGNWQCRSGVGA